MNTEIEKVQEDINSAIDTITLDIPARIEATIVNNATFEFTISIDEIGQIVLTPTTPDVEFVGVKIHTTEENELPIMEQETLKTQEESISHIQTSILIKAHLLAENNNHDISAVVDEIGQIIISPIASENSFVTATYEDSLNLVTEDLNAVEYFGYKLVNTEDGWNVSDASGEILDEGVATLAEAKILVCETELRRLKELTEDFASDSNTETNTSDNNQTTHDELDVTAEVIEESLTEDHRLEIITKFMQGDIALFSDTGRPPEEYIHLHELDANGYSYYYDESTNAVVSYPSED